MSVAASQAPAPLGVILAAGRGSRLGAIGARRPKCLTPLGGRALLDWQRDAFDAVGLRRRVLIVGHCADAIRPCDGEQMLPGDPAGGPMDSLFALPAADAAGGVLMSYGDIVCHPRVLQAVLDTPGDLVIAADRAWLALWALRFDEVLDDAERFRWDGLRVQEIGGRADAVEAIEAQFIGLLKLTAAGFSALDALRQPGDDCTRLLARAIDAGVPLHAAAVDGGWCEVDSVRDLARYRGRLRARAPWQHDFRP